MWQSVDTSCPEMVCVTKMFKIDASHMLPDYDGKCANLHGHTYTLITTFTGPVDPASGMVIDFGFIKELVGGNIVEELDHSCLNDIDWKLYGDLDADYQTAGFEDSMPTAENMVVAIAHRIQALMHDNAYSHLCIGVALRAVHLYETADSYASWLADDQRWILLDGDLDTTESEADFTEVSDERGE